MKIWNSGLTGFDSATMLKEVFGGYAGDDVVKAHTAVASTSTSSTTPAGAK